ncbi:MAG: tetratricopeptide repeat protein [candidate division Zixibacteria bacterium]|nr:tetratricopeptide repeat protein [candidate division Zixibacteria bacterium]
MADYGATKIIMGDTLEAERFIDSAYQIDSNSVYVINTMASYKMFLGDLQGASNFLELANAIAPDDPFTRSNMLAFSSLRKKAKKSEYFIAGNQAFEKALYRKARENYRKALEEDSLFFEVIVNLAYTNIHLGDLERAAELFKRAVSMHEDYAPAYIGWADALIGLNRFDEALEKYEKAIELEPESQQYKQIYNDVLQALEELDQQSE